MLLVFALNLTIFPLAAQLACHLRNDRFDSACVAHGGIFCTHGASE